MLARKAAPVGISQTYVLINFKYKKIRKKWGQRERRLPILQHPPSWDQDGPNPAGHLEGLEDMTMGLALKSQIFEDHVDTDRLYLSAAICT